MTKNFFRQSNGVIVVYDVTNRQSFEKVGEWIKSIDEFSEKNVKIILAGNKIISPELASKLSDAKGMRNIITHEYGEIDDKIVFEALSNEIIRDAREFIEDVKEKTK